MMRRFNSGAVLLSTLGLLLFGSSVHGQDQTAVSVHEGNPYHGTLTDEAVAFKPELGVLGFKDATDNQTFRGAAGAALEFNFSKILSGYANYVYGGFSTGLLYSHLGDTGSSFVGTNPGISTGTGGANTFLVPVDVKIGYNFTDSFRVSVHGGGNVIYNTIPSSMQLATGNLWNIFPNAGGDLDILLVKSVMLTIRPDETFVASGTNFFTGTLALGVAIG